MQEVIDGSTITDLHTDKEGFTWHIMQREGGSICLYATRPSAACHFVHIDTYDGYKTEKGLTIINGLAGVVDAINALLMAHI